MWGLLYNSVIFKVISSSNNLPHSPLTHTHTQTHLACGVAVDNHSQDKDSHGTVLSLKQETQETQSSSMYQLSSPTPHY